MSVLHSINLDALIEAIEEHIKTPERDLKADPIMFIARSFDINKPGTVPNDITGGVLGGALQHGKLIKGAEIEILPGYQVQEKNQKIWKPLITTITSLMTGGKQVDEVTPGGSIAVMTLLDPSVVKSDQLVGNMVVLPGTAPPVWTELTLETHLLERVVGAKDKLVVEPLKKGEVMMLNVNSAATVGIVSDLGKKGLITCSLKRPVCAAKGARVTMSRMLGQRWRLIGYGLIQ